MTGARLRRRFTGLPLPPPSSTIGVLRGQVSWVDVLLAVVTVGLDAVLFSRVSEALQGPAWVMFDAPPTTIVLAGLAMLPLVAVRRRAPVPVCLVVCGYAALLTITIGSRPLLTVLLVVYTASARTSLRLAFVCLAASLITHGVAVVYEASSVGDGDSVFVVVAVASVFALLDISAFGVGRWAAVTQSRARLLEESREAMAAEAVRHERLRIARELHDIVAHAVTVMVLQAAGARRVLATEPALAGDALQAVEDVGKQAMTELRRLLEVLRTVTDGRDAGFVNLDNPADTGVSPGLSTIGPLTERVSALGVSVTVEINGTPGRLDPSVDLTAYRIVQEALTNVTRHAGPGTSVRISLEWLERSLVIQVDDDGAGTPQAMSRDGSSGYGFIGLRERVKLIGGSLGAGPAEGGGYRIHATLPADPS
jgi:signal transduction histidine kinase